MCAFYLVVSNELPFIKAGRSKAGERSLLSRYVMYFGDCIDIYYFRTTDDVMVENEFKKHFKDHCVGGERFTSTHLAEYIDYVTTKQSLDYVIIRKDTISTITQTKSENIEAQKGGEPNALDNGYDVPYMPNNNTDLFYNADDKTYTCIRCGYHTTIKGNFRMHLFNKNKECKDKHNSGVSVQNIQEQFHNMEKHKVSPVVCQYCNKGFAFSQSKYVHLKTCHMKKTQELLERQKRHMQSTLITHEDVLNAVGSAIQNVLSTKKIYVAD